VKSENVKKKIIDVKGLCKQFGELIILENVNTEINKGEVISIIGPSGCGKSTFMRCLNMLEHATSGEILIEGQNILDKKVDVNKLRQKMGMVFQSFNLYSHLMIIENIMLGPTKLLKMSKQEAYDEGMKYLEIVGLAEKAYAYPDELSGGQKQRVAIARTLAMKPEIVLFDEPTSALDPTMVSEVLAVIRKLANEGMTMLIVTHEMKFARDVSSRVFYMDEKGIYEEGAPEQIFDDPQKPKTRAFINKIRGFNYLITSRKFDLYELNAKMGEFLRKQMFTDKQISSMELICEELLCNLLLAENIDFTVEYSDASGETNITAKYAGAQKNPLSNMQKDLSFMIISKSAKDVFYGYDEGNNVITIKI